MLLIVTCSVFLRQLVKIDILTLTLTKVQILHTSAVADIAPRDFWQFQVNLAQHITLTYPIISAQTTLKTKQTLLSAFCQKSSAFL